MPRLYREAPLNSIWEGSGNVNALDVLRAMQREPDSVAAFDAEVELAHGMDRRLDQAAATLKDELANSEHAESRARSLVEKMAVVLQGSLLLRHGDPAVADLFCSSRIAGQWGHTFGTLPNSTQFEAVIERHRPRW